ncbi:MAG: HAD-IIIA family hydrolase [Bacteroidales bacterium]|nr:HAD-IIIA family hydrolase [Bacteroidales bacterium]
MAHFKTLLKQVQAFVFDVDGVMSTAKVYLHPTGDMMRSMNVKDGYSIQRAVKAGYPIAIISGAASESIRIRFETIGVQEIFLRITDKRPVFEDFCKRYNILPESVMYMGDDIPDYEVMSMVGLPVCPADAAPEIKSVSKYISHLQGGEGCVRDVVEQVMKAQLKW